MQLRTERDEFTAGCNAQADPDKSCEANRQYNFQMARHPSQLPPCSTLLHRSALISFADLNRRASSCTVLERRLHSLRVLKQGSAAEVFLHG